MLLPAQSVWLSLLNNMRRVGSYNSYSFMEQNRVEGRVAHSSSSFLCREELEENDDGHGQSFTSVVYL